MSSRSTFGTGNVHTASGGTQLSLRPAQRYISFFCPNKRSIRLPFASRHPIDILICPTRLKVGSLGTHNTPPGQGQLGHFCARFDSECLRRSVCIRKGRLLGHCDPSASRRLRMSRVSPAMPWLHRYHDVDTKIVRIFTLRTPHAFARWTGRARVHWEALTGKSLTIFCVGSQTRSFCYVSDLIDGIFRLAMSDFHEPVNIGNPREMTIKQFADEIIRITGTKSGIEYRPLPEDDPKVRQPDIGRAKKILGWDRG